jgi:hypothetical protein
MFAQHRPLTPMASAAGPIAGGGADGIPANKSSSAMAPVFAHGNLVSVFGPLGLLPHLWALWELLMTGRDIVVVSELPSLCSEVAIALSTLTHPCGFRGELWPYVSARGSEADDIEKTLREKAFDNSGSKKQWSKKEYQELLRRNRRSVIIGITNPALLKQFGGADAVIFASYSPTPLFGLERYSSRLSASVRLFDSSETFNDRSSLAAAPSSSASSSGPPVAGSAGHAASAAGMSGSDFYMSTYRLWSRGLKRVAAGVDKRDVTVCNLFAFNFVVAILIIRTTCLISDSFCGDGRDIFRRTTTHHKQTSQNQENGLPCIRLHFIARSFQVCCI